MNPTKQAKLKALLDQLNSIKPEVPTVKNQAFQLVSPDFFDKLNAQLDKVRQEFNLAPVIALVEELKTEIEQTEDNLLAEMEDRIASITQSPDLTKELEKVKKDFTAKFKALSDLPKQIEELKNTEKGEDSLGANLLVEVEKKLQESIKQVKMDFSARLNSLGGGSMNRQMNINSSVMSNRYTDINFKNSTTIAWTKADDNVNKVVNITASLISGGGGSLSLQTNSVNNGSQTLLNLKQGTNITVADDGVGGVTVSASAGSVVAGITRVTSVISVSSTIAAATLTDYAIFANVGIQVTLPTAISNSNLYTVKNMAASSVLIGVTAGQTIDGSSTALLATQYQSLDLISNGSVWGVI